MSVIPRDTKFNILTAVQSHWTDNRFGPTVQELKDEVGLASRSTVQFHINDLLDDGYLTHRKGKRRTLKVTKKGDQLIRILTEET
jgi:repressor LexA